MDQRTVGILGGGQLGRMLAEAAHQLNIDVCILDAPGAPAKQINASNKNVDGSYKDPKAIQQFAVQCDILTTEIEHVNTKALQDLSLEPAEREHNDRHVDIQPSWSTIQTIQDKFRQKEHFHAHAVPVADCLQLSSSTVADLQSVGAALGLPFMLKSKTDAYDGRGNYPIRSQQDFATGLGSLGNRPLYAERWVNFQKELAVMVVKTANEPSSNWASTTKAFPVVETVHEDSICKLVFAPARNVSDSIKERAQSVARSAVASFWGKGIFGVEMFLLTDGTILVNEVAPRPHNSGHYTIESCAVSQFTAHLKAILDLPINETNLQQRGVAIMLNILGGVHPKSHVYAAEEASKVEGAFVHLYGKHESRPGRKMGHVTILADNMATAMARADPLVKRVDALRATDDETAIAKILDVDNAQSPGIPVVAVTMGSESDRGVLRPGIDLLETLKIPYAVTITSAHRTPRRMVQFAESAADRGFKVIIAAAGGAAHLPGMIAACTRLPVIGVPVKTSNLEGLDSLLSIVQMPRGCPVATVAINNSVNAVQLAARILANHDHNICSRLEAHLANQTSTVEDQAQKMESRGFHRFDDNQ